MGVRAGRTTRNAESLDERWRVEWDLRLYRVAAGGYSLDNGARVGLRACDGREVRLYVTKDAAASLVTVLLRLLR